MNSVTLEGEHVRLEPLSLAHLPSLTEVGLDPDLWRWTLSVIRTPEDMRGYVAAALADQDQGRALPFAIVGKRSGRVAGSTRYGNIDQENRRIEIGWTWLARPWQRTVVNTEAKLLLLRHAFEVLDCVRVELKTDALNDKSRRAILRLGAREEGVMRQHMITASGRKRDTVYFSILDREWPEVDARLSAMLGRPVKPADLP